MGHNLSFGQRSICVFAATLWWLALTPCNSAHAIKPTPTPTPTATPTPSATPTPAPTPTITGTAYYIDSAAGSDANAGTQSAPWQTLSKVQALIKTGTVAPGTGFLS